MSWLDAHPAESRCVILGGRGWRDEKLVLHKLRVHPYFVARFFPPLRRGGQGGGPGTIGHKVSREGGVDWLVRTRASEPKPEELKISAVVDADTPPDPPPSQGGEKEAPASSSF